MLLAVLFIVSAAAATSPHLLFVMVDDFGWGDVGFHRTVPSAEVMTPTMDALVKEGIELNRHYVHQMCTPTRSSFLSGRLPVHVQLTLAGPCSPSNGIPRNMTTIATKLRKAGYQTHQVGKWDAGMTTPTHTPAGRGFMSSLNYFSHGNWAWTQAEWQGSYNHRPHVPPCDPPGCAIDLWDTAGPGHSLNGTKHEELLFRERFLDIIDKHDPTVPLFLYYAPKLVHYPLEAPLEYQEKFKFIEEDHRRTYAAMVNFLDDQLKALTDAFKAKGLWDNTLMVLSSDNGGYVKDMEGTCADNPPHGTACFNGEAGANNYPHRGGKYTVFEGGVRVNAFAAGGLIPSARRGTVENGVIHVADWYATFCGLSGLDASECAADDVARNCGLPAIDSIDVWGLLSGKEGTSPRSEILIDGNALIQGDMKVMDGKQLGASWSGPQYPNSTSNSIYPVQLDCTKGCLFNVTADPTEHHDLSQERPGLLKTLLARKEVLAKTIWHRHVAPNDKKCMQLAFSKYGGFLGPYQEI